MKATVDVADRAQRDAVKRGLEDPVVKAFAIVVGVLSELPPDARRRVLQFVTDKFADEGTVQLNGS